VRLSNPFPVVLTTRRPSDIKEKDFTLQTHSPNSFTKAQSSYSRRPKFLY
jgi:hypothetical protein